ncbi:MAG: GUN4 domain-containing protein [Nostoc sp. TH1S01]|nr:GUN4 domain-containing protein [Nostoc sp. TH1S01]
MEQLIWGITGQRFSRNQTTFRNTTHPLLLRREFLNFLGLATLSWVILTVSSKSNQSNNKSSPEPTPTETSDLTPEPPSDISTPPPENTQPTETQSKKSEKPKQSQENTQPTETQSKNSEKPKQSQESTEEISLKSEKGIDYTKLKNLLAKENWKEADEETYQVMNQIINGDWNSDAFFNFPCQDLSTIDQLWVKYSKGHFGYSVQKEIYLSKSVGGKNDGNREYEYETWRKFNALVGLGGYSGDGGEGNFTFNLSAPQGHLPRFDYIKYTSGWNGYFVFLSRVANCNI